MLYDDTLRCILSDYVSPIDRIRCESVSRKWRALSLSAWNARTCSSIDFESILLQNKSDKNEPGSSFDSSDQPKRVKIDFTSAVKGILLRAGPFVKCLVLGRKLSEVESESRVMWGKKRELSYEVLLAICELCPKLETLHICRQIVPSMDILALLLELPQSVGQIFMDYCRIDACNAQDGLKAEAILISLFRKLRNLKSFSMRTRGSSLGHLKIFSSTLDALPQYLQHLDISSGQAVHIADLEWCQKTPNLLSLSMERSHIDSADLYTLSKNCPKLSHLNLAYSRRITNFSPISLLSKQLQSLILDGNRDSLTDVQMDAITQSCTNLKIVSLECCAKVTSSGFCYISRLKSLEELRVPGNAGITDSVLESISSECGKTLQKLEIRFCRSLNNSASIIDSLKHCCKLVQLSANGVPAIDVQTKIQLTQNAVDLHGNILLVESDYECVAKLCGLTLPPIPNQNVNFNRMVV